MSINKRTLKQRAIDLLGNNWLSKLLFQELPLDHVTPRSQLYVLQREERGDGVSYRPIRATIEDILAGGIEARDEGNAFTTYLPTEIFDESNANATSTSEETFSEGGAVIY